jgi:hypothetical protein
MLGDSTESFERSVESFEKSKRWTPNADGGILERIATARKRIDSTQAIHYGDFDLQ